MTAPRLGDRVRVVFEGVVEHSPSERVKIVGDGRYGDRNVAHVEARFVDVLVPNVQVGDVVETRAQLDALPAWSVVRHNTPTGFIAQKDREGTWRVPFVGGKAVDPLVWAQGVVVLHVEVPS